MSGRGESDGVGVVRPAALLGSAILHAILLALLARQAARPSVYDEAHAVQVLLVPTLRPGQADRRPANPPPPHDRSASAPTVLALPANPAWPSSRSSPDGAASNDAAPGADDLAVRARQALRGRRGCDQARLTREARERCEAERWAHVAPLAARLNLDPSGRYATDPTPYLARRPKEGCRARMTGDVGGLGDDQNVRAGVTCVIPF